MIRTRTAPESVKRVKSSAQILDKSFFWRLSATNALGGSSSHQRTPLLNTFQKWSPLMTGATSKCICGFHLQKNDLTKICLLLFTLLTLSGAVCTATTIKNLITSSVILSRLDVIQAGSGPDQMIFWGLQLIHDGVFFSLTGTPPEKF